jgi:hypothetical protein
VLGLCIAAFIALHRFKASVLLVLPVCGIAGVFLI